MSTSRKGKPILKRKTSSKKMSASLKRMDDWIKENKPAYRRKRTNSEIESKATGILYGYYGITFNRRKLNSCYEQTKRKLHKWLNRRGG